MKRTGSNSIVQRLITHNNSSHTSSLTKTTRQYFCPRNCVFNYSLSNKPNLIVPNKLLFYPTTTTFGQIRSYTTTNWWKEKEASTNDSDGTNTSAPSSSEQITLNLMDYKKWNAQQVASVLTSDESLGGAGLTVEKVKPLYEAGFDGSSLHNIVENIKLDGVKYAIDQLQSTYNKSSIPQLSDTCQTVVFWVLDQLMTRQYSLWKLEPVSKQIIQKLGEPIAKGGADLSLDQVSSLDSKTLYTIASDLASFKDELVAIQNMKNLDTTLCTKVVKWVNQFLLQDKIQVKKFTFPTPSSFSPDNIEEMVAEDELDKKYLQSKNLHKSEKAFLDDLLNNYTLKDLTKPSPIATDKMSFKMKHREETIKLVVSVAKEHLNFKKGGNKQGLNFFIAKGGSGSGKSRILTEIPNIMRKATELDAIFQNTQIIYFNFANGFSLDDSERDKASIPMIVSRIVYAAFEGNIEDIIQKMPSSANDSLLYGVLKIISMKLHEQYKSTEIIPLVLAFDEYQLATRHISGLHTTIQHKLGWYMRHVQFQHQILLFPAFAGTLNENDAKMEPTQYTPATLPLPSLRSIDIQEIMQDLGLSALYERNREFWNAIGVVPRHLQWALEGYDAKKQELQNMVDIFNEDTVISSIYYNVTNTVQRQYGSDLQKPTDYFVELALRTLSGLSETEQDDRITKYIREGKVYDTNDFVGLPLVVIDILATKKDCIPKQVVTDFITATSKKPRWEIFEEVCIKTMTARFNVLYTVNKPTTVPFSRLFKGAHFAKMGRILLETTNDEWFRYCCLDSKISDSNGNANNELLTLNHLAKTKKNHKDIDGVFCPLINVHTGKRIVFVVQNKFQQEDSEKTLLSPGEIVEYYENAAKTPFENSETFVIIFTNKKISKSTRDMIEKGKITTTKEKKELVVATDKLIVVSGDCFDNFFHPFVANILLGGQ